MIARIEANNLGPHKALDLTIPDPMGHTEFRGPSESGKSVLVDAVTFAIWGLDHTGRALTIEQVTDGADHVASAVTTARPTRVSHRLRIAKSGARGKLTRGIDGEAMIAKAMLKAVGPLGIMETKTPEMPTLPIAIRIMTPMGWLELARSAGGGVALRNCIAGITEHNIDIREVVADMMASEGHAYGDVDAANEAGAKAQRMRAKAAHQRVIGALDETQRLVDAGATLQPVPDDPVDALALIDLSGEWASYRYASEEAADHARAVQAVAEWDARLRAIGPQPPDAGSEVVRLRDDRRRARERATRLGVRSDEAAAEAVRLARVAAEAERPAELPRDLVEESQILAERLRVAHRHLDDLRSEDGTCPTCTQPWDRSDAIAAAEAVVAGCAGEIAASEQRAAEWIAIEEERRAIRCEGMTGEVDAARATLTEARRAAEEGRAEVVATEAKIATADAPGREWSAARKALGSRPRIPPAPRGDDPPTEHEPTDEELRAARDAIADAERKRGAAEHHRATVDGARARVAQLRAEVEAAAAEAERCEALVRICRAAPTEGARRSLEALGDISPVSMRWTEAGGVDVLVDGRPWRYASQGRQIVADAVLRAGMRRAIGMDWLPIIVDQVQSVEGQELPDIDGPVWLLRTSPGAGLDVVAL